MSELTLYESHPSMFRSNPVGFIISVILIFAFGFGLLILFIWRLRCIGTTLTATQEQTILRKGIFSKYTSQVYHSDVRNVQLAQSFLERIFGVGTIGISSSGQAGMEIEVSGIPAPAEVEEIINRYGRQQRK